MSLVELRQAFEPYRKPMLMVLPDPAGGYFIAVMSKLQFCDLKYAEDPYLGPSVSLWRADENGEYSRMFVWACCLDFMDMIDDSIETYIAEVASRKGFTVEFFSDADSVIDAKLPTYFEDPTYSGFELFVFRKQILEYEDSFPLSAESHKKLEEAIKELRKRNVPGHMPCP